MTHRWNGLLAVGVLLAAFGVLVAWVLRSVWVIREPRGPIEVAIAVVLAVVTGMVLLGGIRSISVAVLFPVIRFLERRHPEDPAVRTRSRVAILLCTANDFVPEALAQSMRQDHPDITTFILDDSSDPERRGEIDRFAGTHGVTVVRRPARTGFKAGNLNHFLHEHLGTSRPFDHYVIVDADQVLRPDFVTTALRRMVRRNGDASGTKVGAVQGRQLIHADTSGFARRFGGLLQTHILVTQTVRSRLGFSMFMGRGALISAACVDAVGGFPEVVMEDLAFSVRARQLGFVVRWAPDVLSSEDFPVDYHAFRKQQSKFAQGSIEFLRRFLPDVVRGPMRVREQLDLLLDVLATPVSTGLAIVLFAVNLLPVGPYGVGYLPQQVGLALALCGAAPLLPESIRVLRTRGAFRGIAFFVQATALYTSTLWLTLWSMVRVLFGGRAHFAVTPKVRSGRRIGALGREIVVAVVALVVAFSVAGGPGAAMVFVMMTASAVWMHVLDRPDRPTTSIPRQPLADHEPR